MRDVLTAMIKAHEIQGVLALENSYNRVGLDHVLLVRVASTAVVTRMLGRRPRAGDQRRIECLDRRRRTCVPTVMHQTRGRARAGRLATQRAGRCALALIAMTGEMGYPSALCDARKPGATTTCCSMARPFSFPASPMTAMSWKHPVQDFLPAEFHSLRRRWKRA